MPAGAELMDPEQRVEPSAERAGGGRLSPAALLPFAPAAVVVVGWVLWSHFEGGYFPETWYPSATAALGLLATTVLGTGRLVPSTRGAQVALAALAGLVAWTYLSMAWSDSPGPGWDSANKLLLYLAVAWTLSLLPWTPVAARVALGAWVAGVTLVCAISVLGVTGTSDLGEYFIEGRYLDPIGYSNAVSALPLMAFFPALWLAARRGASVFSKVGFLAAAAFLAEFSLLPQSRGAVIGIFVAALVFVAISPDRLRLILPLLVVATAVALSIEPIYDVYSVGTEITEAADAGKVPAALELGPVIDEAAGAIWLTTGLAALAGLLLWRLDRSVRPSPGVMRNARVAVGGALGFCVLVALLLAAVNAGSISDEVGDRWQTFKSSEETPETTGARLTANYSDQRYDYWRVALDQFERSPIVGEGAGSYEATYTAERRFEKPSKYTHDIWLRFLGEGGLVAGLLLIAFLAACATGLAAAWRRLDHQGRGIVAVCAAASAYFFVHASFDWLDEFPALATPALALPLIGASLGAGRAAASRRPRTASYAAAALGGLLALAGVASLAFPYLAQRHLERGSDVGLADVEAAYEELDQAAALNPLSLAPRLRAGTIAIAAEDPARARREFRRALDVEDNWYSHFELALLDSQAGRFGAARRRIARARTMNGEDPFVAEASAKIRGRRQIDAAAFNARIRRFGADRFTRPKT